MRKQGNVGLVEDNDMPFDDPYKNLAYRTIMRAMMDAVGKDLRLNGHERTRAQRVKVINQAREWIHEDSNDPLSFETMCYGLNIEPDVLRRQIPKYEIIEPAKKEKPKGKKIGKREAHYQRIQQNIQMQLQGV